MRKLIDFTLKNSEGKDITLSDELKNNHVWMLFYRGTFWGAWVRQMTQVRHDYDRVKETGTKILAISVDGQDKAQIMKEKTEVEFDILCDENLDVINKYALVDDELMNWDYIDGKVRKTRSDRHISLSANILVNQKGFIVSTWSGHYRYRPTIDSTIEILTEMNNE